MHDVATARHVISLLNCEIQLHGCFADMVVEYGFQFCRERHQYEDIEALRTRPGRLGRSKERVQNRGRSILQIRQLRQAQVKRLLHFSHNSVTHRVFPLL